MASPRPRGKLGLSKRGCRPKDVAKVVVVVPVAELLLSCCQDSTQVEKLTTADEREGGCIAIVSASIRDDGMHNEEASGNAVAIDRTHS